ncbi:hypothetical protein F909_02665 [Acinetobacter sp. ANC 3929]|uniref:hypothetical protein n=1 Tax=unclassified Acinetobacter TaxID=196816 RepID=UPI0002D0A19F|nr:MULTISPECIES: hypothetical protein [unclassified Acinetobacter]ENW81374.1 hypothetical protein F909_02665 [Acinetobacter sp. ANC 3929]MCH7353001.1 hypothetical protein [Acinetobacter sp. NIPH 2023]MCH7354412.1 hypothetical protein [Acinetobacter sp. NIPH 1958]MCH7360302.1 hypothetical protein [Acinetobacter sp. NIPH 2024]
MPSLMSKQRLHHHICLGLSTLLLSSALISCGSGESKATKETTPTVSVPKPKNFNIKTPVEMRNVTLKVFDNFDDSLVLERNLTTTSEIDIVLPRILDRDRLYRIEISTTPNSLIYDHQSGQYQDISMTLHSLVEVNTNTLTQTIYISPSSEAIYQRALVRSGLLPTDTDSKPTKISALQLNLATSDVNSALTNAFYDLDIPNVNPSSVLNVFSPQNTNASIYINTYVSFGFLWQWANAYPNSNYAEFTKNLAIDLKDGYLDAKKIRGDQSALTSLVTTAPDNIDSTKNNAITIGANQKSARDNFATSLKQAVLQLAAHYRQAELNSPGYVLLQQKAYAGSDPTSNAATSFRVFGAGDYRRAVGFTDTTQTCNGSIYPCKQGITGINIVSASLPSIEYLIGNYKDSTSNCQLNIRGDGWLELTKDGKTYSSKLDGDTTDNLLQVDKSNFEYLLNSSSAEPNNSTLQYNFVQLKVKANQVLSASAGLDSRKAPDQLQTTLLQCNF